MVIYKKNDFKIRMFCSVECVFLILPLGRTSTVLVISQRSTHTYI